MVVRLIWTALANKDNHTELHSAGTKVGYLSFHSSAKLDFYLLKLATEHIVLQANDLHALADIR